MCRVYQSYCGGRGLGRGVYRRKRGHKSGARFVPHLILCVAHPFWEIIKQSIPNREGSHNPNCHGPCSLKEERRLWPRSSSARTAHDGSRAALSLLAPRVRARSIAVTQGPSCVEPRPACHRMPVLPARPYHLTTHACTESAASREVTPAASAPC